MKYDQKHKCSDGLEYSWKAYKPSPKECPRCKSRLDKVMKNETV